jgi:hypothetical protein
MAVGADGEVATTSVRHGGGDSGPAPPKKVKGKFADMASKNFVKLNLKKGFRGKKGGGRGGGYNSFGQSSQFGHHKKKTWSSHDGPNLSVDKFDETDDPMANMFGKNGRKQGRVDVLDECLKAYLRQQRNERDGCGPEVCDAEAETRRVRCPVHLMPAAFFTVKKAGPNKGRHFHTCMNKVLIFLAELLLTVRVLIFLTELVLTVLIFLILSSFLL